MWRFYGYYGGLNVVGNLSTYGQYSDESTFEVIHCLPIELMFSYGMFVKGNVL